MFVLNYQDARSVKALQIAATADTWVRCTRRDGRQVFAVPSQTDQDKFYIVDAVGMTCDCQDARWSAFETRRFDNPCLIQHCKHLRAVLLHAELVMAQSTMPRRRRP